MTKVFVTGGTGIGRPRGATLVHVVGAPLPDLSKGAEFVRVDLGPIRASAPAAVGSDVATPG